MGKNRQRLNFKQGKLVVGDKVQINSHQEEKSKGSLLTSINLATELGFMISIPVVGGAFLGSLLDNKLATSPKITLSLIFLGILISIFNVYKILKDLK